MVFFRPLELRSPQNSKSLYSSMFSGVSGKSGNNFTNFTSSAAWNWKYSQDAYKISALMFYETIVMISPCWIFLIEILVPGCWIQVQIEVHITSAMFQSGSGRQGWDQIQRPRDRSADKAQPDNNEGVRHPPSSHPPQSDHIPTLSPSHAHQQPSLQDSDQPRCQYLWVPCLSHTITSCIFQFNVVFGDMK